jgi:hypothetical protein
MVNERTLQAYKEAGTEYQYMGVDEHLKNEREKTSLDTKKVRKINSMYRFRDIESKEYLLYEQDIITISNYSRNRVQWHEDMKETSMYFVPIVERQLSYDQETEKQKSDVKQISSTETHYIIPFNEEEVNKLKPFTNLATKYYIWQQDGLMRSANNFDEWLNIPFDVLIAGQRAIDEYNEAQEVTEQTLLEQPQQQQQQQQTQQPAKSKVSK